MTGHEAADLATRIAHTWRGGPNVSIWEEELADLDAGRAGTAYARLRRESEHAPSIARFHAAYRATSTAPVERSNCHQCDGTGWERARDHIRTDTDGNELERTTQVAPCRMCPTGEHAKTVWRSILAHNHPEPSR